MAKNPADRYPDVPALVEAAKQSLLGLGPETAVAATPATPGAVPPPPPAPAATPVTTDGGTVVLDETGAPVTRPVEDHQLPAAEKAQPAKTSRGPLLAAVAVLLVLLGLAGATVAFGVWWFGQRAAEEKDLLSTFNELTESGAGFSDPEDGGSSAAEPSPQGAGENAQQGPLNDESDSSGGASAGSSEPSGPRATPRSTASNGASGSNRAATATGAGGGSEAQQSPSASTASPRTASVTPPSSRSQPPSEEGWRNRRSSAQASAPIPAAPQAAGARLLGRTRFGSTFSGEVEPEQPVAIEIEVKRPTTFYFDISFANQLAPCKMLAPDGSVVFANAGGDEGPLQVDQRGIYTLLIETDGGVPIQFQVAFRQIGS